jgi:hypothetical protein
MANLNPENKSPMNLNDLDWTLHPEFGMSGSSVTDFGTVEFNEILFCSGTESHDTDGDDVTDYDCTQAGEIYFVSADPRGKGYSREEVLRRTIVHEMGHGLHFNHCSNPYCIMWEYVENWELRGGPQSRYGFGNTGPLGESCTHASEIQTDGVVHNAITP